ncbi:hypothetical protein L1857_33290 [Amycolatopsis thermalba]|uniref:Uncharacterized protein n=1 Tax=Amycolatopsis thermalba TaxID=944492 RepID=A0ABY4P4L4_9PSEU|nr:MULTISPECIES: hypothetical protein [Amycolatopsis]UQS27326.1 hypothetical protein L1857_33290 [Amycolatopsis thermalba]
MMQILGINQERGLFQRVGDHLRHARLPDGGEGALAHCHRLFDLAGQP